MRQHRHNKTKSQKMRQGLTFFFTSIILIWWFSAVYKSCFAPPEPTKKEVRP